uniref:Uncharacterized protein n=1 Tax=Rhizophora mucronata TaxID=61149 RepID=A0A2P2N5W1_RHIMU
MSNISQRQHEQLRNSNFSRNSTIETRCKMPANNEFAQQTQCTRARMVRYLATSNIKFQQQRQNTLAVLTRIAQ